MLIIGGYKAREITVTYILRTKYCPNLTHPIMLSICCFHDGEYTGLHKGYMDCCLTRDLEAYLLSDPLMSESPIGPLSRGSGDDRMINQYDSMPI